MSATRVPAQGSPPSATTNPVALVVVDVGLAHLDRPFEYLVPASLDAASQPGARVKVRFAGRDVNGFVVARAASAEHPGPLAPIRRVVASESVLTPALLRVARTIADRYAGTLSDVLRLAVPPRHATSERALPFELPVAPVAPVASSSRQSSDPGPWAAYPAGPAFLRRIAAGQDPAASWLALPRAAGPDDWPQAFAVLAQAALSGGRGFLFVVPDRRDVDRVQEALTRQIGAGQFVRLTADQGPAARYTAWLKVLRGHVCGVVGTRSAAFAPVHRLGLVAWWDDGDDLHEEPRAPYPHVREVLAAQASDAGAALLCGGYVRSVTLAGWLASGRVRHLGAERTRIRAAAPAVSLATEGRAAERDGPAAWAHLPPAAWRIAAAALRHGPVLVQVPRRGYLPALTCQECRSAVRCPHCAGPIALGSSDSAPFCRWCGRSVPVSECPDCGANHWRSAVVGHRRTAEELGRAFPAIPVLTSGDTGVVASVDDRPRLVIATPGAEPLAESGYAAALLLDAWAFLDRPSLDAGQEALRRWTAAAALVRAAPDDPSAHPASARGTGSRRTATVVLCGAPDHVPVPAVEALLRWAPDWLADRELAERTELCLPPAAWMAQLTGPRSKLEQVRRSTPWPDGTVLGDLTPADSDPPKIPPQEPGPYRMLVRVPADRAAALNAVLVAVRAGGAARKDPSTPSVRVGISDAVP